MTDKLVLVTGISGYLASHVADQLLKAGYRVRGTVRSLKNEDKVKPVRDIGENSKHPIELVEADLTNEDSWKEAVKDCTYVMHVASPLPIEIPKHEDELLKPAINGTLSVLRAAHNAKVKRVVVTSSGLAITGSDYENDKAFNEECWGNADTKFAYCKSKILAEKAAWNFVAEKKANNESTVELVVINPVLILGPVLHDSLGTSSNRFLNVFLGKIAKIPDIYFPTCDVRDVSLAHVRALERDEAVGERIVIVSEPDFIHMRRWGEILRTEFAAKGFDKIPTQVEPLNDGRGSGKGCTMDNSRMIDIIGIKPIKFESTVIDMANSLIARGFTTRF